MTSHELNGAGPRSAREASAIADAAARSARDRARLRPIAMAMVVVVVVSTLLGQPAPSLHNATGAVLLAALAVFTAATLAMTRMRRPAADQEGSPVALLLCTVAMGAAGIAIAALQTKGPTQLAASAAVFAAALVLPGRLGFAVGAAITVALGVAEGLSGSVGSVAASILLCVVLALTARLLRSARDDQDRIELLYAQLQDARDAQADAAAIAERGRIAAELHDVLAHSLSGAAIQLQGARKLLERAPVEPRALTAVSRAAELVREGLEDARRAVSALHGEDLPTVERLPSLVERFRLDHDAPVELSIVGQPHALGADANLALFRGAQEALTNAARYAPGAAVTVTLCHEPETTRLTIANGRGEGDALDGVGGGHGLAGMHERIARVGGTMHAGATADGWLVELEVPG